MASNYEQNNDVAKLPPGHRAITATAAMCAFVNNKRNNMLLGFNLSWVRLLHTVWMPKKKKTRRLLGATAFARPRKVVLTYDMLHGTSILAKEAVPAPDAGPDGSARSAELFTLVLRQWLLCVYE